MFTVLTEAGLNRLRQTAPTHLRGIEDYMTSRLAPDELDALGALLAKLLAAPDDAGDGDCGAEAAAALPAESVPAG
jgi:hypothetical protein